MGKKKSCDLIQKQIFSKSFVMIRALLWIFETILGNTGIPDCILMLIPY